MTERMSKEPVLLIASCLFFFYVIVTLVQVLQAWTGLSGVEVFAFMKHLAMVLVVAAFLLLKPKIGSLAAVAWGLVVPFERYYLLVSELLRGSLFEFSMFSPLDTARILLLFLGTCTSALLAYQLLISKNAAPSSANA